MIKPLDVDAMEAMAMGNVPAHRRMGVIHLSDLCTDIRLRVRAFDELYDFVTRLAATETEAGRMIAPGIARDLIAKLEKENE